MPASYEREARHQGGRIDGESTKAYAAFTIYRDMGLGRSLVRVASALPNRVAEKIYTPVSPHNPPTNISQIERWSSRWNWVDRCRDYDADCEQERRQLKSSADRDAYLQDLESYQLQQQTIGTAALNFTARSLSAIDYALRPIHDVIKVKGQLTREQIELLFTAQVAVKNLMGAATSGADITAKGLAVSELMSVIADKTLSPNP